MIADENFASQGDLTNTVHQERAAAQDLNINELLASLGRDARELAEYEIQLAKVEAREKAEEVKRGSLHLGASLLFFLAALGFSIIATTFVISLGLKALGLSTQVAYLASFAATALSSLGLGVRSLKKANRTLSAENLWPSRTAETLRAITNRATRTTNESN